MASLDSYDLNDTHRATHLDNVVRIYNRKSKSMEYVGLIGTKQCTAVRQIFPEILNLSNQDPCCVPQMLYPCIIEGFKDFCVPVKCFKEESLSQFTADWFFENVLIFDKNAQSKLSKPLYFTLQFKYFLYSLIKNIVMFLPTKVRPMIDPKLMLISHTGDVIFTKYQMRLEKEHDWDFERNELVSLLQKILVSHGNNSMTLHFEMMELIQYLKNASSTTVVQNLLEEIVFWTPEIRIQYIYQLADRVVAQDPISTSHRYNEDATYSKSKEAFLVDGSNEWYRTIQDSENLVLYDIYKKGNKHVDMSDRVPIKYRTYDFDRQRDSFILICGLVRFRDAFLHVGEYRFRDGIARTDADIQAMYQDLFPQHMVKFKKCLEYVPHFNAKKRVVSLLGAFQNEAQQARTVFQDGASTS